MQKTKELAYLAQCAASAAVSEACRTDYDGSTILNNLIKAEAAIREAIAAYEVDTVRVLTQGDDHGSQAD